MRVENDSDTPNALLALSMVPGKAPNPGVNCLGSLIVLGLLGIAHFALLEIGLICY
jgi:hypothetical protein